MCLFRCRDKIKVFFGFYIREFYIYFYMIKLFFKVFNVVWSVWEGILEKLEMIEKLEKKSCKEKWLDEIILFIEESWVKMKFFLEWI